MPLPINITNRIFSKIKEKEFNEIALEIFHYQYEENAVYRSFVQHLGLNPLSLHHYSSIPFLPVEFYKRHRVVSGNSKVVLEFVSSGTTGAESSVHAVVDPEIYKKSFNSTFRIFYGDPRDYIILGLLPSYLQRGGSSLVYMVDDLIRQSGHEDSGFYLDDYSKLSNTLGRASEIGRKTILIGVSYALLDFCGLYPQHFPELLVMETGGMKGKRRELTREELHRELKRGFGVVDIHSEYGMTELFSQAYSKGEGLFHTPPWMKVMIRDGEDPLQLLGNGNSGGINIIDLANFNSCAFLATQDLGKCNDDNTFEILGRFDSSDIRGCNLMMP